MNNFNLIKVSAFLMGVVLVSVLLLNSALRSQAVEFLAEDYEAVDIGTLPQSHSLLAASGGASVQNASQRDGSMGRVLQIDGGTSVILSSLGDLGDVSVSVDVNDANQSGYVGIRMSPDGQNGYLVLHDAYGRYAILYKVTGGLREELARTEIRYGLTGWNKLYVEGRGNEIRVAVDKNDAAVSSEIVASDNTYVSGKIVLGKDSNRGFDVVRFDNLVVKTPDSLLGSVTAGLPFGASLENGELSYRNNILQHPNIEMLKGGYNILTGAQRDGASGNMLLVSSGTLLKVNTAPLTDVSVSGDLHDVYQSANLGIRMSPDGKNGYLAVYDAYGEFVIVYKVANGVRTELGRAFMRFGPTGWNKIYFEARGQELRAAVDRNGTSVMSEVIVYDGTYSSGGVLISKDAGRGLDFARLDNLVVKLPDTLLSGVEVSSPTTIYFEDGELAYRNNIPKHPSIDLVSGGYNILNLLQRDSTVGNVLAVSGGSSVKLQSQQLGNMKISYDVNDMNQSGYVGIRMSPDGKNGYVGVSDAYGQKLQIFKLGNGNRILFGEVALSSGFGGWNRITLSATGDEIKGIVEGGGGTLPGEVVFNDASFVSGGVIFGKDAGRGLDAVRFDNIVIEGTSLTSDLDGDGVNDPVDACPSIFGKVSYTGCPYASKVEAELHIVDHQKSGICGQLPNGKARPECKVPLVGAVIKIFDVEDPAFISAYGSSRPSSKYFKVIYDGDVAKIGQCATDGEGKCLVGVSSLKEVLVIIRYAEGSEEVYEGEFEKISNIGGADSTISDFRLLKIIRDDGSISLKK